MKFKTKCFILDGSILKVHDSGEGKKRQTEEKDQIALVEDQPDRVKSFDQNDETIGGYSQMNPFWLSRSKNFFISFSSLFGKGREVMLGDVDAPVNNGGIKKVLRSPGSRLAEVYDLRKGDRTRHVLH